MIFKDAEDLIIGSVLVVVLLSGLTLFGPKPEEHPIQPKEQVIETRGPTLYDI